MMHDLAIMFLFVSLFTIGLLIVGGVGEYIVCPLWEHWQENRRHTKGGF